MASKGAPGRGINGLEARYFTSAAAARTFPDGPPAAIEPRNAFAASLPVVPRRGPNDLETRRLVGPLESDHDLPGGDGRIHLREGGIGGQQGERPGPESSGNGETGGGAATH